MDRKSLLGVLLALFFITTPGLAQADDDDRAGTPLHSQSDDHDHTGVIFDIAAGYAYGRNGFIVPKPLVGGLEDGHGGWLHVSLHPGRFEWLGFALGVDFVNKDEGNWGWGLHFGVEFEAHLLPWLRLSGSPFLGYHGERRLVSLSGDQLTRPEILSGFTLGLEASAAIRLGPTPAWLIFKAECGLTAPGSHRYWEWECGPRAGVGLHF